MIALNSKQAANHDAALLAQLPELADWQPAIEEVEAMIDARTASMLAAIFNRPPYRNGDALPPPWHWAFFIEPALQRDVGIDGHPKRGGFLPPISLPSRMFAGSDIRFNQSLIVGETYRRVSNISSIDVKQGRSGRLVFLKVQSSIVGANGEICLTEEQDIVYRERSNIANAHGPSPQDTRAWSWIQDVFVDPVMLFRYSAVTFNGHRIHYDLPYASQEEGYPDLVIHGPLLATIMLNSLQEKLPFASVARFRFVGKGPVFARRKFHVAGRFGPESGSVELGILSDDNIAMTGHAMLHSNS